MPGGNYLLPILSIISKSMSGSVVDYICSILPLRIFCIMLAFFPQTRIRAAQKYPLDAPMPCAEHRWTWHTLRTCTFGTRSSVWPWLGLCLGSLTVNSIDSDITSNRVSRSNQQANKPTHLSQPSDPVARTGAKSKRQRKKIRQARCELDLHVKECQQCSGSVYCNSRSLVWRHREADGGQKNHHGMYATAGAAWLCTRRDCWDNCQYCVHVHHRAACVSTATTVPTRRCVRVMVDTRVPCPRLDMCALASCGCRYCRIHRTRTTGSWC